MTRIEEIESDLRSEELTQARERARLAFREKVLAIPYQVVTKQTRLAGCAEKLPRKG